MIIKNSIDPKLIGDFKNIEYPDRRQFPDNDTVNYWKSLGHYYVNYTGLLREEYRGLPQWCLDVKDEFKKNGVFIENSLYQIDNLIMSIYCMPPGTIMPEHSDYYVKYRSINNIEDSNKVCRILVFLDDWKSGHYFELNKYPIVNWSKGDYYSWKGSTPHIAANIGSENRYTLQITAMI